MVTASASALRDHEFEVLTSGDHPQGPQGADDTQGLEKLNSLCKLHQVDDGDNDHDPVQHVPRLLPIPASAPPHVYYACATDEDKRQLCGLWEDYLNRPEHR